jgi:hypothetical protein
MSLPFHPPWIDDRNIWFKSKNWPGLQHVIFSCLLLLLSLLGPVLSSDILLSVREAKYVNPYETVDGILVLYSALRS